MSQAFEKPARKFGFGTYFALAMVAVAAILTLALGPFWLGVFRMAGEARPHAPDLSLFAGLSTPIKIHLVTALAALALGGVLMAARKGRTFHRLAGWTWVGLVSVSAGVTVFITSLNNGSWSWIHLFTGWTLLVLPLAVLAAKRHDAARHRRRMMGLFYGAFAINFFIAFIPGRVMWAMVFG